MTGECALISAAHVEADDTTAALRLLVDRRDQLGPARTELIGITGSRLSPAARQGPSGAARLLGEVSDIRRFASRAHIASWNGTAPIDASSGANNRHRPSRAGNRRINRALHIMAIVQLRHDTTPKAAATTGGRLTEGKPPLEALRALKRRRRSRATLT